jgi:antitoxin MazE
MHVNIIPIGNSKGIRIPKALLEQCGMSGSVELTVKNKSLLLKPINEKAKPTPKPRPKQKKKVRDGWDEDFKRMAANGDDVMLDEWPPTEFDLHEWTW